MKMLPCKLSIILENLLVTSDLRFSSCDGSSLIEARSLLVGPWLLPAVAFSHGVGGGSVLFGLCMLDVPSISDSLLDTGLGDG
jgi:hypothetical protein